MGHLVQPSCRSRVTYSRLHRTLSRQVLNISREGDSTTTTTHQLLQANHTSYEDLSPTPIGTSLTLVRRLLQHDDLNQLLEQIQKNGQRTLITVHHDTEKLHGILERVKKDGDHHWKDTLFGWSPRATRILNQILHPITISLIFVVLCLLLNIILYVKV